MDSLQKRLLATTIDDYARTTPDERFAVIPRGSDLSSGFQTILMKDMAAAVNSMCWWIESMIGPAQYRETLAYLGNNDLRYFIFMIACQKTGYQAFFPSTRNSDEAHLHLLKATNCSKFFYTEERQARTLEIKALCSTLDIFQTPAVNDILKSEAGLHHYAYTKSYAKAEDDTILIIHSSGTTGECIQSKNKSPWCINSIIGMPKPVYLTNGFFMTLGASSHLHLPAGRKPGIYYHLGQESLVLATTPLFHLMGLMPLVFSVWFHVPTLLGPEKPPSVDFMIELLRTGRPTHAICAPSVLEDMSYSSEALLCLQQLEFVMFGGAPLSPETGERLLKHTRILSVIGTSEVGWIPTLIPEDLANWGYFEWNEAYGLDMQDIGDGVYEMVIPRQHNARDFKGIYHTDPDINEYHTKDLYTQHPTNPCLWKYYGRKDDVIVLSNGEKFNPINMETIIAGHPLVGKAVVVGQSRFQAGLLIEVDHGVADMDTKAFIDEIWPTVQVANQTIAAHGRVMKNKIGFALKDKPFKRTPKGSVQRRAVLQEYADEIDALYAEASEDGMDQLLPETLDEESVTAFTRQVVARVLERSDFSNTQTFDSAGLDSLMTIRVSQLLQWGIQMRRPDVQASAVSTQAIYGNPTIDRLSQFVVTILGGKSQVEIPRAEKIEDLVEKYTSDLPIREAHPQTDLPSPTTVILTGSTGSLGNYLLHSLLSDKRVSKVYCLNRSDAESRQKQGFEAKGLLLTTTDWQERVEFLQASFGEPRFGLDEIKYQELLGSVDTIVHNAWKVDFNHSVDSFEDTHIQGVRRFVDFSLSSRHNAHLHFVSSVSTVGGWTPDMGASVPEIPMEDSAVVLAQGYGESKHVAERICLEASRRSHVPTTVYRVGQIAGPKSSSGQWNPHEWLPTIIATSKALGKIPNRLGSMPVDWVPVDTLSEVLVEIVHTRHRGTSPAVFHLTNSELAPWLSLIPAVQEAFPVEPVDYSAWVAELESISNPSAEDLASMPALKLLPFYRGLQDEGSAMSVPLDVSWAKVASQSMRALGPVSAGMMRNWLSQWRF
ncbi:unnamed protein product [Penicillium salamii]|uniref:Carrier domain-containing protein n=1 Tax=Penicillium salamii TaxID=1612424 RepID=A0A9W4J1B1_9EURO|nr:unnamed protein product [Penicillium salamii]CAG8260163.1 unnamed protein product [Penicillium salamii]CAG8315304.1 unnamed protein product [Penicillium salamii]CAG8359327.1 unnamed protein product [Penicillium salamii]CAG8367721.1 unnamed protein product [Penicillium salamii]